MARSHASLVGILARRRWSAVDARTVLDALKASGLSQGEFAARYDVQAQRLRAWQRRLSEVPTPSAVTFVEVASPPNASRETPRYELVLAGGDMLRIEGAFEVEAARALVALLRGGSGC